MGGGGGVIRQSINFQNASTSNERNEADVMGAPLPTALRGLEPRNAKCSRRVRVVERRIIRIGCEG